MKSLLSSLLLLLTLSGCALFQPKDMLPPIVDDSTKKVEIDARLLEECGPLDSMPTTVTTTEQVLAYKMRDATLYSECSKKHRALANTVRKAFNLPK